MKRHSKRGFSRAKIDHVEPICVECGRMGKMASGIAVYPHLPDRHDQVFYVCECGAAVSCHAGTAIPAGRPASAYTRKLRYEAHRVFDPIWQGAKARSALASGYARELGIKPEACHIGFMGADQLRQVIALCNARREAA